MLAPLVARGGEAAAVAALPAAAGGRAIGWRICWRHPSSAGPLLSLAALSRWLNRRPAVARWHVYWRSAAARALSSHPAANSGPLLLLLAGATALGLRLCLSSSFTRPCGCSPSLLLLPTLCRLFGAKRAADQLLLGWLGWLPSLLGRSLWHHCCYLGGPCSCCFHRGRGYHSWHRPGDWNGRRSYGCCLGLQWLRSCCPGAASCLPRGSGGRSSAWICHSAPLGSGGRLPGTRCSWCRGCCRGRRRQQRHWRLPHICSLLAQLVEVPLVDVAVGGGTTLPLAAPQLKACTPAAATAAAL